MKAELRWVFEGKVGLCPTATDLLEAAELRLSDPDEMDCCKSDDRLSTLNNVRALLLSIWRNHAHF